MHSENATAQQWKANVLLRTTIARRKSWAPRFYADIAGTLGSLVVWKNNGSGLMATNGVGPDEKRETNHDERYRPGLSSSKLFAPFTYIL